MLINVTFIDGGLYYDNIVAIEGGILIDNGPYICNSVAP
jgi:hypothetical protein